MKTTRNSATRGVLAISSMVNCLMIVVVAGVAPRASAQLEFPQTPIDLDDAHRAFEQLASLSIQDDGALWGMPLDGPMLFVDRETRFVVANAPDRAGALRERNNVFVGTLPLEINIANTTTQWAGVQWAMVTWPLPKNAASRGTLMVHESFHRIQPDLGLPLALRDNAHLDDARGRTWLRLEMRALAEALSTPDSIACEALRDALWFRAYRHAIVSEAREQEAAVELNEGLAEYTGVRLGGLTPDQQVDRAIRQLRRTEQSNTLTRTFAYATGLAYGLLLDRSMPEWRSRVARAGDVAALLASSIRFRTGDLTEREAHRRGASYNAHAIIEAEAARQAQRAERIAQLRRTFVDGPVLIVPLDRQTRFSFNPHGAETLPGYGPVYASMRLTGSFGVLEARGPVLWVTEGSNKHFRVAIDPDSIDPIEDDSGASIIGNSFEAILEDGWTIRRLNRRGVYRVEQHRGRGR